MSVREPIHLKRNPIAEAVLEYQFTPSQPFSADKLSIFASALEFLPKHEILNQVGFEIQGHVTQGVESIKHEANFSGFKFSSEDGNKILQITQNSLAFSQMAPYVSGDHFIAEFVDLWNVCREMLSPKRINRIGLRCINVIDIPMVTNLDFDDYFNFFVKIPDGLPQILHAVTIQAVIPDFDKEKKIIKSAANVALMYNPVNQNEARLIMPLDIDVYRVVDLPADYEEFGDIHNELREFRNKIFFNCITDKIVHIYQE